MQNGIKTNEKQWGGARLLFLSLLTYGFLFFPFTAHANVDPKEELVNSLDHMGYIDIKVDSCKLSFARLTTPTSKNNGLFRYERIVHLETLNFSELSDIVEVKDQVISYYFQEYAQAETYYEIYNEALLFDSYIKSKYPELHWPYLDPSRFDEWTVLIEAEILNRIGNLDQLNLWINYSSFGRSTTVSRGFQIGRFR